MKKILLFIYFIAISNILLAIKVDSTSYVSFKAVNGYFSIFSAGKVAALYAGNEEYPGVIRSFKNLQEDIGKVTRTKPLLSIGEMPGNKEVIIAGTLGKNPIIDQLVSSGKLNVQGIIGKWETFLIQVVENPTKDIERALIIAGSDKRGTIFGIYDLAEQIGVSPWYWWADVPVKQQSELFVKHGRHTRGEPAIRYRGIFINDEAPAMTGWASATFGPPNGFNSKLYVRVFELILRLKGNFLWPAMWGKSFFADDKENQKLADEYGIVISTSHHEPLMRADVEWHNFGNGKWDYSNNSANLKKYWKEGIERMNSYESIVTVGMRGLNDTPINDKDTSLLEKIIFDQRQIIGETTKKDPASIPQVWALYKEVQKYYDKGMRIPDDVTILYSDDNWGNIRRLPRPGEKPRPGGYGIYYHLDYVGGPRSYRWLNTNPLPRIWEQMHLAYEHNVNKIWIVNVGDLKPMEFPTSFFLDYAWAPTRWDAEGLSEYSKLWALQQFGPEYASKIAEILAKYGKFNGRRKPELIDKNTYSLVHYREAERIVEEYNQLLAEAEQINEKIALQYKDAYYQLILHPIKACANLNEMYYTAGKNTLFASQGRAATNDLADKVKELFNKDSSISRYYNTTLSGGKWNHMMDQAHIGYTTWADPGRNIMPDVKRITLADISEMGVAVEGSGVWWPFEKTEAVLPQFDVYHQQKYYIEIFNRGIKPFNYKVTSGAPWLLVSANKGLIDNAERIWVSVTWDKVPTGKSRIPITITDSNNKTVVVYATVHKPEFPKPDEIKGFIEGDGYISMEAEHFSKIVNTPEIKWQCLPDFGRTLSGMTTFPVTSESLVPGGNSPRLEYNVYLFNTDSVKINVYVSPTINYYNKPEGMRYAVSFDDEKPQIISFFTNNNESVANNIVIQTSVHLIKKKGPHVLKYWLVDPGVVLQKIIIDTGNLRPSYLGPPE